MKRKVDALLLLLLSLLCAPLALATDNVVQCTGNSCNVKLIPRSSGGSATPAVSASATGVIILGNTTGSAPPAGDYGETVSQASTSNSTASNATFVDFTNNVTTTSAGTFLCAGSGGYFLNSVSGGGASTTADIQLINASDSTIVQELTNQGNRSTTLTAGDSTQLNWSFAAVVTITSAKSFRVRGQSVTSAGSPTGGGVGSRTGGSLSCTRVY